MYENIKIIILAAGKGTRMKSILPKVLIEFKGISMIKQVVNNVKNLVLDNSIFVVVKYKKELIQKELNVEKNIKFITQENQLGTGHAVLITENEFKNYNGNILILFGDSPLISNEVLNDLIMFHKNNKYIATILIKDNNDNFEGVAKIIRNSNNTFKKSIEYKDLLLNKSLTQNIKEINVGVMIINSKILFKTLKKVKNNNVQKEYYLPDVINILSEH
jgi:bifunctional UDP-N-acetylglucosamine pyrophosphorylase/glucosamine-1-phosphate N-acetyltransferase